MSDSFEQRLGEGCEKLKVVLSKQEKFTLSFGRSLLILLATILCIAGIGLLLYTILSPFKSDFVDVNEPKFSGHFDTPK